MRIKRNLKEVRKERLWHYTRSCLDNYTHTHFTHAAIESFFRCMTASEASPSLIFLIIPFSYLLFSFLPPMAAKWENPSVWGWTTTSRAVNITAGWEGGFRKYSLMLCARFKLIQDGPKVFCVIVLLMKIHLSCFSLSMLLAGCKGEGGGDKVDYENHCKYLAGGRVFQFSCNKCTNM